MKTSNVILFTLVVSISLTIVAGAVQLRLTGVKRSEREEVFTTHELREFRYLVIRSSLNLAITPSQTSGLLIGYGKGENKPIVRFHQQGDTLFIDEIKFGSQSRSLTVTIKTPLENLEWIEAQDAAFSLDDFSPATLRINLNNSRLYVGGKDDVLMGILQIKASNHSGIYGNRIKIDTLELYLDESESRLAGNIYKLKGYMKNNASVHIPDVTELEFKKDTLSRWFY